MLPAKNDAVPVAGADPVPIEEREDLRNQETWNRAFALLTELGNEFPSFRLGQLICALASHAVTTEQGNVYDLEDDELVAAATEWLAWRRANR